MALCRISLNLPRPLGVLVSRAPAHPKRPGQSHERFGLGVPAARPRAKLLPHDDFLPGGLWAAARHRPPSGRRRPPRARGHAPEASWEGPARHVAALYRRLRPALAAGLPGPLRGSSGTAKFPLRSERLGATFCLPRLRPYASFNRGGLPMEDKTMTADTPKNVSRRNFIKGVVASGAVVSSAAICGARRRCSASSRLRLAASSG